MISNSRPKYTTLDYKFSKKFRDVDDSYRDIKLPYVEIPSAKRKILFVLDYLPTEDLKSGKLLNGATGDLLDVLEDLAKSLFLRKKNFEKFSWFACTFNAFRTAGKPRDFQNDAKLEFAERINSVIVRYKPDAVVIFGDQAFRYLLPEHFALAGDKAAPCTAHL